MSNYQTLLEFTLKKRLFNKTFIITNIVILTIMLLLGFVDLYIERIMPSLFTKPQLVVEPGPLFEFLDQVLADSFEIVEEEGDTNSNVYYLEENECFDLSVKDGALDVEMSIIQNGLLMYMQSVNYAILSSNDDLYSKEIIFHNQEKQKNNPFGFIIVTSIYFFAISFASIVANDVVYEKSTRMMELILTSTDATTHLLAKLSAGWITILVQFSILLIDALSCAILRYFYDGFEGIVSLLKKIGIISSEFKITIKWLFNWIRNNQSFIGYVVIALIVMFIGILLIQAVLMILSSFISSIEEAGTIQTPFYLLFLAVYYLTIFLSSNGNLDKGLGRFLSLCPFFSMLLLPCRLFESEVSGGEIALTIFNSLIMLILVISVGSVYYKRGVLDYGNRGKRSWKYEGRNSKSESC